MLIDKTFSSKFYFNCLERTLSFIMAWADVITASVVVAWARNMKGNEL